jgi:hypothetical protein
MTLSQSPLRLAMIGMIPGNGHPWSWSAIINGYEAGAMSLCPYEAIPEYLGKQDAATMGIPGAEVTHIWTDRPEEAPLVAAAAKISRVVDDPKDVIGEVDAVVIATDDGADHVRRAAPFVEAGLPVFVDKPLATHPDELRTFRSWRASGARILSSSGMRYSPEFASLKGIGWRWLSSTTAKTWERYGIHALEPLMVILGRGFVSVRSERQAGSDVVYLRHVSGAQATIVAIESMLGSAGRIQACADDAYRIAQNADTYTAFRGQLVAAIDWFRSGSDPYPFAETEELMAVLIAGIRSRDRGGELIQVETILQETAP